MGISCSIYDQLEIASMHQQLVRLKFNAQNNESFSVEGVIDNLFTKKSKEYVSIKDGKTYCLDQLISIELIN
ncbi:Rho-binding antiterminator [Thiomicrorhabdus sp.]|uniref:Rho-binding antiterminator n=1 Tax=Thiomicrorhabdus sp. TaxID=2039724 RepID=UPI003B634415